MKRVKCLPCGGTGRRIDTSNPMRPRWVPCEHCHGEGKK